ncbi:ATP-grasp domain-containing protein [Bacillus sp. DJP31]|uniref:ATP-grasp domain-containing protein n=1 Tax=Bacillus sp. DJP31 TaxID=3409789 RepID=UPI003BB49CF3
MKIWFNRWFSTVSHYIEMIRNNPDGKEVIIYGTYPNKDSVYLQACDFAEIEPDIKGKEYIDYCLEFCKKHQIDVFIPRKENVLISKHLSQFNEIGTKVLVCPDSELMEMMDNKDLTYKAIEESNRNGDFLVTIPDYYIVNCVDDFMKAYESLKEKGHTVCFKPVIGEGANGFRVIKEQIESIDDLFTKGIGFRMTYSQACEILSQQDTFPPLMVLEFLEGREYSIDCLADGENLYAIIPRMKGEGRIRKLEYKPELIEIAKNIYEKYRIPYVFNIQVKYRNGVPKLLEINPRMSGGLHISCLSGVNYPYLALKLLLNEEIEVPEPSYDIKASHLEHPVILT